MATDQRGPGAEEDAVQRAGQGVVPRRREDPDLELVQVEIRDAEFWNVKESKTTSC
jgi:hypothetical protein